MKELPGEILVLVVDYVTLTEKLEVACVCKNWLETLSQTTLYNKLTFKNLEKFNLTTELCNKKQNIIYNMRDFGIFDMDYDMQPVMALPALFPKITSLVWKDERRRYIQQDWRAQQT